MRVPVPLVLIGCGVFSCLALEVRGAAAAEAVSEARPASFHGSNDYTRSVARPYQEVMAAVERAAKEQGFRVSNVHDIAASLKKDGIHVDPVASVEVCNSTLAAQVLKVEPRLASLMPCRIAVFERGDQTTVSMVLPSRLMTMFPARPEVQQAAAQVDRAMKAIVDAATR